MSLDNLTPAIGYEWQVQGVNCSGEGSTTEWSEVSTFTTLVSLELADDDSEKPEGEKNSDLIGANANKKADVSISDRTLWKDECWNTLCLPFSMTAEQVTAQLAPDELKELDTTTPNEGHVTGVEGSTLYLNFKDSENGIVAGVPYIIRWASTTPNYVDNPVFKGVTIVNGEPTVVKSTDEKVSFKGNYTPVSFSTETPSILFVGGNNTLYYPQPANAGQPVVIGAFRAYFQLEDPTAVRSFSLNFGDNSKSNGIMTMSYTKKAEGWYTLDGRKLLNAPKRKGLYIHNGVKVTIK